MNLVNAAADFVATNPDQETRRRTGLRYAIFASIAAVIVVIGNLLGIGTTAGWIFGYAWGGLTVHGLARQQLRKITKDCERYSDQRDAYMRQVEGARERETWARAKLAQALDDIESIEGDCAFLFEQNVELRARAEEAELRLEDLK